MYILVCMCIHMCLHMCLYVYIYIPLVDYLCLFAASCRSLLCVARKPDLLKEEEID